MKRHIVTAVLAAVLIMAAGCAARHDIIRRKLRALEGKEEVSVVLVGHAFFASRWMEATNSDQSRFLKRELGGLLGGTISIINTSEPADTVNKVRLRVQSDILSFRPDIVILNLGLFDSMLPAMTEETYRQQLRDLFGILKKNGLFVVVVSSTGYRDILDEYDTRVLRLKAFNEILLWEAGHHEFPVITVGEDFDRLRINNLERYRAMFSDEYLLSDTGRDYVVSEIIRHFKKAFGS